MPDPRQALGQYFTPPEIVSLAYDLLAACDADAVSPTIVDPACGSGVFLQVALQRGLTSPDRCFGLDRDPSLARAWGQQGWRAGGPGPRLALHDGLYATPASPPWLRDQAFDWVVGNPPYAGRKLSALRGLTPAEASAGPHASLCQALAQSLTLWRRGQRNGPLTAADLRRLSTFPIELLFLQRFGQLARPKGFLAIVLPEGSLTNRRHRFAREWLLRHFTVCAVVALPRGAFRSSGAVAKTSLLVARKSPPRPGHRLALLDAAEGLVPGDIADLLRAVAVP